MTMAKPLDIAANALIRRRRAMLTLINTDIDVEAMAFEIFR